MKPITAEIKKGEYRILHQCTKCKIERWNKTAPADNFDIILMLIAGDSRLDKR
jgi:hypothetical protein